MADLQFHQPTKYAARWSEAYPPASYEAATMWYLSFHNYLLMTISVILIVTLLLLYPRRSTLFILQPNRAPQPSPQPQVQPPPPMASQPSVPSPQPQLQPQPSGGPSWKPTIRAGWEPPHQGLHADPSGQTPGGRLVLEIDFNEMHSSRQPPQSPRSMSSASVASLRFGPAGNPAPVQELDASRVRRAGTGTGATSGPTPRLRGGYLSSDLRDTDTVTSLRRARENRRFKELLGDMDRDVARFERFCNRGLTDRSVEWDSAERARFVELYRSLKDRLDHVMRLMGMEPDDLLAEIGERAVHRGGDGDGGEGADLRRGLVARAAPAA